MFAVLAVITVLGLVFYKLAELLEQLLLRPY
jgi:ABC-type nitrate/sulfonate/bicarbonate transport system permease component